MPHKCDGCFWKTDWGYVIFCERMALMSFWDAKDECEKPGPCPYYMTREEVERVVDKFNEILLN